MTPSRAFVTTAQGIGSGSANRYLKGSGLRPRRFVATLPPRAPFLMVAALIFVMLCGVASAPAAGQSPVGQIGGGGGQSGFGQSGATIPGVPPVQAATSSLAPVANQSMLYPGEDFQLGPGDLLTVRVYLQADYAPTVRIGLDGSVDLPLIGSVHLQGLTVRKAQELIADRLRSAGMYRNPEVAIQVLESLNGTVTLAQDG
jgi:Polysaccharide biosynthesis/export protein